MTEVVIIDEHGEVVTKELDLTGESPNPLPAGVPRPQPGPYRPDLEGAPRGEPITCPVPSP
jgi:hypothetical protein